MKLLALMTAKRELSRLEQKYARRRNRNTFSSGGAIYVDGEYRYPSEQVSPSSTGS